MNNIKALIIDDEALACDMLEYLIQKHVPSITSVKKAVSASKGIALIKEFEPDILFLDVQMPFMNGFELLQSVSDKKFSVIFTTAFNKYAIRAIRFSALDYLLKPVDPEELASAIMRFLERKYNDRCLIELYKTFTYNIKKEEAEQKLAIRVNQDIRLIAPAEIIRCEAQNNYTKFFLKDNSTLLSAKTIKEYEELLGIYRFIRVHKSHLVNFSFVKKITAEMQLVLEDGSLVEISRRRKDEVMEYFKK